MIDVLSCIDLNEKAINNAYKTIEDLFSDLNMKDKAENIIEKLPTELSNTFEWAEPTRYFIRSMFTLAAHEIRNKYPDALVSFIVPYSDGYKANIDVDDDTYKLAEKSYEEE